MRLPETWKEWGQALAAFVPGPLSTVLLQWQALFSNTLFAHRQWQDEILGYAIGPSILLALGLVLFFFDKAHAVRKHACWVAFWSVVGGLIVCVALNYLLKFMRTETSIDAVILIWGIAYFLTLLAIAAIVSLFVLLLLRRPSKA